MIPVVDEVAACAELDARPNASLLKVARRTPLGGGEGRHWGGEGRGVASWTSRPLKSVGATEASVRTSDRCVNGGARDGGQHEVRQESHRQGQVHCGGGGGTRNGGVTLKPCKKRKRQGRDLSSVKPVGRFQSKAVRGNTTM